MTKCKILSYSDKLVGGYIDMQYKNVWLVLSMALICIIIGLQWILWRLILLAYYSSNLLIFYSHFGEGM